MIILGRLKQLVLSKFFICFLVIGFVFNSGFAQEMSKKELKEKKRVEKSKATLSLIESKTFTFVARTAIANKGRSINLTSNPNYFKMKPDFIESSMPFFGRVTGGSSYGGDGGLEFEGKPEKFIIETGTKKYKINAEVKDSKDSYRIFLDIGLEGNATLTISSNNRSSMTYYGEVSE